MYFINESRIAFHARELLMQRAARCTH